MLREEKGQAIVEFVLIMSLFLMLLFGIFEAGRMMLDYSIVANAAEEGARWASVRGSSCTVVGGGSCKTNAVDIQTYTASQAAGLAVENPQVTWPEPPDPGSTVVVTVTYIFNPLAWFIFEISPTVTLSSTARMVIAQ